MTNLYFAFHYYCIADISCRTNSNGIKKSWFRSDTCQGLHAHNPFGVTSLGLSISLLSRHAGGLTRFVYYQPCGYYNNAYHADYNRFPTPNASTTHCSLLSHYFARNTVLTHASYPGHTARCLPFRSL
jgi:hypothetical protein